VVTIEILKTPPARPARAQDMIASHSNLPVVTSQKSVISSHPLSAALAQTTRQISGITDLLHQYRVLVSILKDSPTRYSAVPKGSFSYKRILLQARGLKAQFFNYDDHLTTPLLELFIYTSSNRTELPIVIDTGASCLITPVISDFNDKLEKPDIPGLNQLTGQAKLLITVFITLTTPLRFAP
jgi:hypothetical protein